MTTGTRIIIIGCAGSGKTTLSYKLSYLLGLPIIHLDKYYWKANWGRPNTEEWEDQVLRLTENEKWIMDGNYTQTLPIRLKRCSCIIFLDIPRWKCLFRVLTRRFKYLSNKHRLDIPSDCKERLSLEFYKWVWNYKYKGRLKTLKILNDYKGLSYHLKSQTDISDFLNQCQKI